jgi:uracil phosphoribosyltransferase
MNRIILKAQDLDGFLSDADRKNIADFTARYDILQKSYVAYDRAIADGNKEEIEQTQNSLISLYNEMGQAMQDLMRDEKNIHVYSFRSAHENHAEASRLIAKLRDSRTENNEFIYYIQRAYELLFKFAYTGSETGAPKNYLVVKTPVTRPVQNYAVHKITNVDAAVENSVMCVMLRGALLPAMIMSKEIEGYSSHGYVTPFALFKISRDDSKMENNMEYVLDLDRSYFNLETLDGKDLIFADPMNATGGSLVTIVKYLQKEGVKPRSVQFFNAISALKGALRTARAIENCQVYTLWMDAALNDAAYILPGLGDAGDRINGKDSKDYPRNMIQLLADYGRGISNLYRAQLRQIEATVLGK